MTQTAKPINTALGLVLCDPNNIPPNLFFSSAEDSPEKDIPIIPYEGWNIMPTQFGYRSFFGTNSKLDISSLGENCDYVFLYQFETYQNALVAVTDVGIFTALVDATGAIWTHQVVLTAPTPGTIKQWTHAVIENNLYLYRQDDSLVYKLAPNGCDIGTGVITLTSFTPTFLNMAGQMGIFRANGRLGFWDSANSVAWSSALELGNLTPAIETLAGNSIFTGVRGRIVSILAQGDGFIIYSTKNIVGVRYAPSSNFLWDAKVILEEAGISNPKEACIGASDLEQYAWTNSGFKHIGSYSIVEQSQKVEEVFTELFDMLKRSRDPVHLHFINGRYLFVEVVNNDYIDGIISFWTDSTGALANRLLVGGEPWDGINILPSVVTGNQMATLIEYAATVTPGYWQGDELSRWETWLDIPASLALPALPWYDVIGIEIDTVINRTLGTTGSYALRTQGVNLSVMQLMYNQVEAWENYTSLQATKKALLESYHLNDITPEWAIVQATTPPSMVTGTYAPTEEITNLGVLYDGFGSMAFDSQYLGPGEDAQQFLRLKKFLQSGYIVEKKVNTSYAIASSPVYQYRSTLIGGTCPGTWYGYGSTPQLATLNLPPQTCYVPTPANEHTLYIEFLYLTPGATYHSNVLGDFIAVADEVYSRETWTWDYPLAHYPVPDDYGAGELVPDTVNTRYGIRGVPYLYNYHITRTVTKSYILSPIVNPAGFDSMTLDAKEHHYDKLTGVVHGTITLESSTTLDTTWALPTFGYPVPYEPDAPKVVFYGNQVGVSTGDGPVSLLPWDVTTGTFGGKVMGAIQPAVYQPVDIPGFVLRGDNNLPTHFDYIVPGSSFLMQDGSVGPIYPTYAGAFVYDTASKKWGKLKKDYKQLLDYSPINSLIGSSIPYANFALDAGMLDAAGDVYIFDAYPADGFIRYGKIGFKRLGITQMQEVNVHLSTAGTGKLTIDTSLDGYSLDIATKSWKDFTGGLKVSIQPRQSGEWHTVSLEGYFDITAINFLAVRRGQH